MARDFGLRIAQTRQRLSARFHAGIMKNEMIWPLTAPPLAMIGRGTNLSDQIRIANQQRFSSAE
jgi:hypothetical protein